MIWAARGVAGANSIKRDEVVTLDGRPDLADEIR
jgi:hypothetical protein